jgi:DNA-binding transcriptional MerR regulator
MQRYTVKQVARLSGVSVRTLHHYDEIGLLAPAHLGDNRYRYYGEAELLRLQQILFHRELGFALNEIAALLDRPGFDRVEALRMQRERLEQKAQRYAELVRTIDRTIADLNGKKIMKHAGLFKGFAPEQQAEYERWLVERHGERMRAHIDLSTRKFAQLTDAEKKALQDELSDIETELVEACRRDLPPDSLVLAPVLERHRAWVATMWGRECPQSGYGGLGDMYLAHPDFRARFEAIEPGFTEYLAEAMKAHSARAT